MYYEAKEGDVYFVNGCVYVVDEVDGENVLGLGRDAHHKDWIEFSTLKSTLAEGCKLESSMAEAWVNALEEYKTFKVESKQKYDTMMLQQEKLRSVFQKVLKVR